VTRTLAFAVLLASTALTGVLVAAPPAWAGQAPAAAGAPDIAISHRDRVYAAEQFSNTVSVTDPADNKLLGVIRLGDPAPGNLSPLYHGQLLVHGMGFSPDHRTLSVVSIGSNAVTFIDTATNAVKHTTYVGRSPHEAFFTPDGREVWVTVRGENYVAVLDGKTFEEKARIAVPAGPGMTIFSPDGTYGYVCSSFNPEVEVIGVADHKIVGHVKQASPFCPDIAATPDGKQVWFTLKDVGKTQVFDARPPFGVLKTLDTGPITNHVNIARNAHGQFAYVTVGGLNEVQVYRTDDFSKVATIPVGKLPHGLWPSGDGTRMYVGLENADGMAAIDTMSNTLLATVPIGQAPQAVTYVPDAVPQGDDGTQGLQSLGVAGQAVHLTMGPVGDAAAGGNGRATTAPGETSPAKGAVEGPAGGMIAAPAMPAANATAAPGTNAVPTTQTGAAPGPSGGAAGPTSVTLFDQGLLQVLQASVTGLAPKQPYVLALSGKPDGSGALEPLAAFVTNPAGAAIVNALGPIRQVVRGQDDLRRRYLVIASGTAAQPGAPVQVQRP
jgi:YVTN family beta-propeller protein